MNPPKKLTNQRERNTTSMVFAKQKREKGTHDYQLFAWISIDKHTARTHDTKETISQLDSPQPPISFWPIFFKIWFSVKVMLMLDISNTDFSVSEKVAPTLNISDAEFNFSEKVVQILNISVNMMLLKCIVMLNKCIVMVNKCTVMLNKCIAMLKKCIAMLKKYILMLYKMHRDA